MGQYILKTLGCKANLSDTQAIEAELKKRGWIPAKRQQIKGQESQSDSVDLCIINSCTVTNEADRQSKKMATRLARENPHAKIIMTGCGAEVDPEGMSRVTGVHAVVGNQNKGQLVGLVETSHILKPPLLGSVKNYKELLSKHPHDREWPVAAESFTETSNSREEGQARTTRAFLKIQEGCDAFCSYCIIPYGRGPNRSLDLETIVAQVQRLVDTGTQEVILTGTNIGEYGLEDGAPKLDLLVECILERTTLGRLRVSSLDPTEITPRLLSTMQSDSRFCPHFHVSLQSPHSRILRLMKRKYRYEDVEKCLHQIYQQIRNPSIPPGGPFVGMDLITGFPGETEAEFEWTYETLQNLPWTRLHVFPYSERAGTPATRLPHSVPQSIRFDRARRLNELSLHRLKSHYSNVLQSIQDGGPALSLVLLEKSDPKGWSAGYTSNYLRVLFRQDSPQQPTLAANSLVSVEPYDLMIDSKAWDVSLLVKVKGL